MSEATEMIKSLPQKSESQAMLEVREARTKLREELEGLSPEQRRRFFEEEHRRFREWVTQIHNEEISEK